MKRVAVLAGGWSAERPISLVSGAGVFEALKKGGFNPLGLDLVPDQPLKMKPLTSPFWARRVRLSELLTTLRKAHAGKVLICLHGSFGEDGRIQGLLDMAGIKYTGSGALASGIAMQKHMTKQILKAHGLPTPLWIPVAKGAKTPKFSLPCVVKPAEQGSALGVSVVKRRSQLPGALKLAWRFDAEAIVESFVAGRELTVGVLGDRTLPVVEIIPNKAEFYDYASKYDAGGSTHLCPAPLSAVLGRKAQKLALETHRLLGCRGYSRTDMMLDKKNRLWILEINTLPGMTPVSLLPDAARAAGINYLQLLKEMLRLA